MSVWHAFEQQRRPQATPSPLRKVASARRLLRSPWGEVRLAVENTNTENSDGSIRNAAKGVPCAC